MEEENTHVNQEVVPTATSSVEASSDKKEHTVPLSELIAERQKTKQLQQELENLATQYQMYQQQSPKNQSSLRDDDVVTVADLKNFMHHHNSRLEEMQMAQLYPDYLEVISTYLPKALEEDPALRASLQKTQDPRSAYFIAKGSKAYHSRQAKKPVNVNTQAGSLASVGSNSSTHAQMTTPKTRSDEEILKEFNQYFFSA